MKKNKIIPILVFMLISLAVNAQVNVFPTGQVSFGTLLPPAWPCSFQFMGGGTVFSATPVPLATGSSPYIRPQSTFSTSGNPDYTWYFDDWTGMFHPAQNTIAFSNGGTESMRILNTSHILMGTLFDAGYQLNVDGGNKNNGINCSVEQTTDYGFAMTSSVTRPLSKIFGGFLSSSGEVFNIYGTGDVWCLGAYTQGSDISLKENIKPINNALSKVLSLQGCNYNFKKEVYENKNDTSSNKPNYNNKTQIGLIAQDVEKIVPEVVSTNEKGLKGIAYPNLVPLLIEAIKEQNVQIEKLKSDLDQCCTVMNTSNINGINNNKISSSDPDKVIAANPNSSYLFQNTPNPFNQKTIITYYIAGNNNNTKILVFDMQGQFIKDLHNLQKNVFT